jgi:hypothetical protein
MSLSIDCTLKICMSIQGQASHRPSSAVRNAACFDDAHSLRRVLTIRGRTGACGGHAPDTAGGLRPSRRGHGYFICACP